MSDSTRKKAEAETDVAPGGEPQVDTSRPDGRASSGLRDLPVPPEQQSGVKGGGDSFCFSCGMSYCTCGV